VRATGGSSKVMGTHEPRLNRQMYRILKHTAGVTAAITEQTILVRGTRRFAQNADRRAADPTTALVSIRRS
jgi:hypothetical protein